MTRNFKKSLSEIYMEVNTLVWTYKNEELSPYYRDMVITDILEITEELVSNLCKKTVRRYTIKDLTFEDLYVIATGEVLFMALNSYSSEKNDNFMMFWKTCIERRFNNELQYLSTQKRSYERTHLCSSDAEIDSEGNTILTYKGVEDFSEQSCDKLIIAEIVEEFEKVDKLGKLIRYVVIENDSIRKEAFMKVLGCSEYGPKERKQVQRTKERFKKLLISKGITSANIF